MKNLLLLGLLSTLLISSAFGAKCGDLESVKSFETEVVSTIPEDAPGWSFIKTSWADWKAKSAVDYSSTLGLPASWQTYFQTQKTCCDSSALGVFKSIIKIHLGKYLGGVGNRGYSGLDKTQKIPAGDGLEKQINDAQQACFTKWLKDHPPASTSVSVSASASASVSISIPASILKIMASFEAEKKKIRALTQVGFGTLGLSISRLFRGTRIALCLDPDAVNADIWASGAVKVLQADVDAQVTAIKGALDKINTSLNRTKPWIDFEAKRSKSSAMACDISKIVDDFKAKAELCKDDPGCAKLAATFITSAWTIPAIEEKLLAAPPAAPAARRNLASSITPGSAGVSANVADDTEDAEVVAIGGYGSLKSAQEDEAAADATLASNGSVDYNAVATVYGGNSNLVNFALYAVVALFLCFF